MKELTLQEIYQEDCTPFGDGDKGTYHSYIAYYESLLAPWRHRQFYFMEIGIAHGRSIRMWQKYFPAARIFAVDVEDKNHLRLQDSRTEVLRANAAGGGFLELLPPDLFGIILDDGSHRLEDQKNSFALLRHRVASGGLYIVEDVLPENVDPLQVQFPGAWQVMDLRPERPGCPDNILMIHRAGAGLT